jgi:hypothetical protein
VAICQFVNGGNVSICQWDNVVMWQMGQCVDVSMWQWDNVVMGRVLSYLKNKNRLREIIA